MPMPMLPDTLKKVAAWLPFTVGLLAGAALAYFIYAGLQPRLQKAVRTQQALKAQANALATADTAKAKAGRGAAPRPAAGTAPATTPAGAASAAPAAPTAVRLTTLAPSNPAAQAPNDRPWLAVGLALAAALAAGAGAWQQYWRQPQPPGAITSPVLEALFTLQTHRDILQKTLGLSPRQIKRFSSKARVQHSQLRAQARPGPNRPGIPFPVNYQIKAFQVLLLLEENRKHPQRFPQADAVGFISLIQMAYTGHPEFTSALLEADLHPVIVAARAKEGFSMTPDPTAEERFLRQLYEMNDGLLA